MFERYTEQARRTIFFARYEASQLGSSQIEAEHLLLGLLREDRALASQFLQPPGRLESMRHSIRQHAGAGPTISLSVDLPLSHESKRVLAYAAEESQRMESKHIGTPHLLLGLLREENAFAAQLLRDHGVKLALVREQAHTGRPLKAESVNTDGFDRWLAELEARGGVWAIRQKLEKRNAHVAIFAGDQPGDEGSPQAASASEPDASPAERVARIRRRIHFLVRQMERAIVNQEFKEARFYSDEERKEHENLRLLREQFNLEEPPPLIPFLCIDVIGDDHFSLLLSRCDEVMAEGVPEIWLLDLARKRAYTVTKTGGLQEFKGEVLRVSNPPLEMILKTVFG